MTTINFDDGGPGRREPRCEQTDLLKSQCAHCRGDTELRFTDSATAAAHNMGRCVNCLREHPNSVLRARVSDGGDACPNCVRT